MSSSIANEGAAGRSASPSHLVEEPPRSRLFPESDAVTRPIPSYRRVDHIGIVVPDLEQAITFFATTLQAQLLGRGGRAQDREYMVHSLGAPDDGAYQMAMIRVPPDLKIELFRAWAGIRFVYFRAPWGLNLELLDYSKASATHDS
jgi:hypothetical protein